MNAALQYARAGVNLSTGGDFVRRIIPRAAKTHAALQKHGAQLLTGVGGFGAAVSLPGGLSEPVIVSATDGVGTKVELAADEDCPQTVGEDAVAMCVNDLLCCGVLPLYFLDYFACGKLRADFAARIIDGIVAGCELANCALIGGETAEMPGVYAADKFDVAGFAVGVGEKKDLFAPKNVCVGDEIIALASNGAHSNGYSLIRKILRDNPSLAKKIVDGDTVINKLLQPTRIYCNSVAAMREEFKARGKGEAVRGIAHITGGGLVGNLPRILPKNSVAKIRLSDIPLPPLFSVLQQTGNISDEEMRRVFNCGVGLIIIADKKESAAATALLNARGEKAWRVGEVTAQDNSQASDSPSLRFV